MRYDVAVVGAGPAGAMAARYAALGGRSVVLYERLDRPSHPVRCGEGVGLKGMSISLEMKKEWILAEVNTVKMFSPAGHCVELTDIGTSYVIDRAIFDNDMVTEAVKAGATLKNNTTVKSITRNPDDLYEITTTGESDEAAVVICADGVDSRVAKNLGWYTTLHLDDLETCAFARVHHPSISATDIEFHIGNKLTPYGYVWVFPRGNGVANVGLGVLASHHKPGLAANLLDQFIEKRFEKGAAVTHRHCGGVPVGQWVTPLVRGGAMIVGDAARQVNALNGGGIAYALFAGRSAGEAAAAAFVSGKLEEKRLNVYETAWKKYCGKQQMRSYALKSFLYRKNNDAFYDSIARHFVENAEKQAKSGKKGKLGYLSVFLKTFAENPLMMVKVFFLFR